MASSVLVGASPRAGAMPMPPRAEARERQRDRWVTGAVALVALAVYLRSLLPGIGFSGDTAKWQMLSRVGGVPHATGYPLYLALIQAFDSVVPLRTAAWRTNLFSAVCAAAAVAMLYRLLRRLDLRWGVAAATTLTFAFTTAFWTQAVVAEVYTLHALFLVSILTCLARWRLGGSDRWLLAGLVLAGLSFGNHLTTLLVLPAVAWLLWSDRQRFRWRHLGWAAGAAVLAASQYLYLLYLADAGGYVESAADGPGDLVRLVTGGPFRAQMLTFTPVELVRDRVPMLFELLRDDFRILLLPMAYGLVRGLGHSGEANNRGRRDVAGAVGLLGLGSAVYGLNFDVLDVIVFFLPLFLALAVFLGIGLDGIVSWVGGRFPDSRSAALGVAGALVAIPLVTMVVDYPKASQRGTVVDQERIERALDAAGEDAVLLTDNYDDSEFFWYYLLAEGLGETHRLGLVHEATPGMVEDYFQRDAGRIAVAVARLHGPGRRPVLLATSHDQAETMEDVGLTVTRYGRGLWRIGRPR